MTNWPAVWAVFAAGLAASAYITKVPPALPDMRAELGLTLVESGLIATTFNVMGMLMGLLAGVVCDRFGHKRLALAGLAVLAAGGALGALAHGFAALLVSRFLEGTGFILCVVSAPSIMTAVTATARDRVRALGLWSAYMPTGGSIALLLAPVVISGWGWRGLWGLLALSAAGSALIFARVVPDAPAANVRSFRLVVEALARPGNIAMALLFAFYVAQWNSILIWLPTFLVEQGASTATASLAAMFMVSANIPGTLSAGILLARGVKRGHMVMAATLLGALCEIGMLSDALPTGLRYGLLLSFSVITGVIPGAIFGGLPLHAPTPQHIATGNGIAMQTSQIGQFLGPLAIAWLATRFGTWHAGLWALLAFAAGALACGLALGRIEARMGAEARIRA